MLAMTGIMVSFTNILAVDGALCVPFAVGRSAGRCTGWFCVWWCNTRCVPFAVGRSTAMCLACFTGDDTFHAVFPCVVDKPRILGIMAGTAQKDSYEAGVVCSLFVVCTPRMLASWPVWIRRTVMGVLLLVFSGRWHQFLLGSTADRCSCQSTGASGTLTHFLT